MSDTGLLSFSLNKVLFSLESPKLMAVSSVLLELILTPLWPTRKKEEVSKVSFLTPINKVMSTSTMKPSINNGIFSYIQ